MLRLALSDVGKENDHSVTSLAEHFSDVAGEGRAHCPNGNAVEAPDADERRVVIEDGTLCGALAAAVAVLYSVKERNDAANCQDELMDWFNASFGSYDCEAIAEDSDASKEELCPKVILATYLRLRDYIGSENHLAQKTLS
jgi:hypothetical protein